MRDETRKRLEASLASDRWLAALLVMLIVVVGILIAFIWFVPAESLGEVNATVTSVRASIHQDTPRVIVNFDVDLDDGRHVMAASTSPRAPNPGDRVVLRETTNWIGYHKFRWDGLTPDQPKAAP